MEQLIVGWDGVSSNMLSEFDVETPFLSRLRESGVSGPLQSVDTPTTLPAWTTFATGKDPGSHGITNMVRQTPEYEIEPAPCNTADPALYDFVSEATLINLPGTVDRTPAAPATQLVSSFLCADPAEAVPAELQDLAAFDDYRIHDRPDTKSTPEQYVADLCAVTRARSAFTAAAFDRYDPRVGFVLFSTPDWIGHFLSYTADEDTRAEWYRRIVELVDDCTAQLAQRAENVVICSDHGFERKPKAIHLQTWFRDEGYLTTGSEQSPVQRFVTGTAKYIAKRFEPLYDRIRNVYFSAINAAGGETLEGMVDMNPDIEFGESTAWHLRYGCIYINDDRFVSPAVADPTALRGEIREQLLALTDDDGSRIFSDVVVPAEAYADPDPAVPDLIARPAPGYLPLRAFSPQDDYVIDKPGNPHYDHRYEGLIAAAGPQFSDGRIDDLGIVDVLPTLLHALGEPLSPAFDGVARTELLTREATPTYLNVSELPVPETVADSGTATHSDEALDRLEQLGYLE